MVNLELFNIVEDIKKVSKAFVVHPKYVNAENAASTISFLNRYFFSFFFSFCLSVMIPSYSINCAVYVMRNNLIKGLDLQYLSFLGGS